MKYIVIVMAVLLSGCAADKDKKCIVGSKTATYKIRIRNPEQDLGDGTDLKLTKEEFERIEVGDEYKGGNK